MIRAMRWVHICIRLLILAGAVWVWMMTSSVVYDILDMQVLLYKWLLQAQQYTHEATNVAWTAISQAGEWLWLVEETEKTYILDTELLHITEKLVIYTEQLQQIAMIIWVVMGGITYKILFDIVFGIRKHITQLKQFID